MLKNALAGDRELGYSEDRVRAACLAAGIDHRSRPEELAAGDYIRLAVALTAGRIDDDEKKDSPL